MIFWQVFFIKVEKILKGSLDLIPSPLPSAKIQVMGRKVSLRCKGKNLLPIIWILTEVKGDGIKSRLHSYIFSTLHTISKIWIKSAQQLGFCNIVFVILTCFHLTNVWEMENSDCLLKTKWLMKELNIVIWRKILHASENANLYQPLCF